MKVVKKKIAPEYYNPVCYRMKNFEIRKDEDGIEPGDILILREYENGHYTAAHQLRRRVKYVLRNVPEYGLKDGYCIIGW